MALDSPAAPRHLIFFETTELHNQYRFTSNSWVLVREHAARGVTVFATSDVTIREVTNQWRKDALKDVEGLERSRRSLIKKISRDPLEPFPTPVVDIDQEVALVDQRLRAELIEMGVVILDAVLPPYDETIRRNLLPELPFQANEKGWRDFVIWWTFLDWAGKTRAQDEEVYFVTANTNDYSLDGTSFAPALVGDLDKAQLGRVHLRSDLKDLLVELAGSAPEPEAKQEQEQEQEHHSDPEIDSPSRVHRLEDGVSTEGGSAAPGQDDTKANSAPSAPQPHDTDTKSDVSAGPQSSNGGAAWHDFEDDRFEDDEPENDPDKELREGLERVADQAVGETVDRSRDTALHLLDAGSALPAEMEGASIASVSIDAGSFETNHLEHLNETTHLWTLRAECEILVEGYVSKSSLPDMPPYVEVTDYDWNDHMAEVQVFVTAQLEADARGEPGEPPYVEIVRLEEVQRVDLLPLKQEALVIETRPMHGDLSVRYGPKSDLVGILTPSRGGYSAQHLRHGKAQWFPTKKQGVAYIYSLD